MNGLKLIKIFVTSKELDINSDRQKVNNGQPKLLKLK